MKNFLILVLAAVVISACGIVQPAAAPVPAGDTQATIAAIVATSAEQTLAAQPLPTTAPPSRTWTPVLVSSPSATESLPTATSTAPSFTPVPNLTTTPVTATSGPVGSIPTATSTKAAGLPGTFTITPTLGILTYGTLPPAVPSARITVINRSKAQAYISLQNYPPLKEEAFLEYPVESRIKVKAPLGYYLYVVWVGGKKIVGEFHLQEDGDITITIFKDKVEVK